MSRNPRWTEEEIILATELYVRAGGRILGPNSPEVLRLSNILNRLPIHDCSPHTSNFRNPSGVALKLANIRFRDPNREGGLSNGGKLDALFWERLDGDEEELFRLAQTIKQGVDG